MLFGLELMIKVTRWGFGDRKSIEIIEDNLIPGFLPYSFNTMVDLHAQASVSFV
jgi:hypothetical protein